MRIWLAEVGENLPIDDSSRVMRTGMLAKMLAGQGHDVVWWADSFNHLRKTYRSQESKIINYTSKLRLVLLHGPAYYRNVSFARIRNQRMVASEFYRLCESIEPPDVIYCGYPTIELAANVCNFAFERSIPLLLDIRDPWPHLLLRKAPPGLRWLGKIVLKREFEQGRTAIQKATAITATSESFLQWALDFSERQRSSLDEVFYLAYEEPKGQAVLPVNLGPNEDEFVLRLFFVGGFGDAYDLTTVVDAIRKVEMIEPRRVQLVLAGEGPQADVLRRRAAGLNNVVFTGWISAEQIRFLLSKSHVGLIAISSVAIDSVPNKTFEYMSGGLALLNTTRGDLWNLIEMEGVGLNYAANNSVDLSEKILSLLYRPERLGQMRSKSKSLYLDRFNAATVYANFCRKLLSLGSDRARSIAGSN
jgi:glycosyltransferase involved in cell wall biosynthesis